MKNYLLVLGIICSIFSSCCDKHPFEGENTKPTTEGEGDTNITTEGEGNIAQEKEGEGEIQSSFWNYPQPFLLTYKIISQYPHDNSAFTQGLIWEQGILYESTGLYGKSSLRIVELETGIPINARDMPTEYEGHIFSQVFAEGIAIVGDFIYQLTWREGICFVYSKDDLELQKVFYYNGEGWGLTYDGENLIMSDGSATIYFRDPETFQVVKTIRVQDNGIPVTNLNELEYIDNYICANVWYKNYIVIIRPDSGKVVGKIDLSGLKGLLGNSNKADVLNGIAFRNDNNTGIHSLRLNCYPNKITHKNL